MAEPVTRKCEGRFTLSWHVLLATFVLLATLVRAGVAATPPAAVKNLSGWYDGSDNANLTLRAGSYVTQINDKSGKGNTLTQATSADQPSLSSSNGYQGLSFNGTSQYLVTSTSTTFATGSSPSAMFIVGAYSGAPTGNLAIAIGYGSSGSNLSRLTGKLNSEANAYVSEFNADVASSTLWTSSPMLHYVSFGTSTESIAINGGAATSGTFTPNTPAGTALYLGVCGLCMIGYLWTGTIYEALLYNGTLTTNEQQFIEGYLACKWGLQSSLPSTHPYKSSCPSTATPALTLTLAESPTGLTSPGGIVTYTTTFTNASGTIVYNPVLSAPIPANTEYQVGSATQSLGSTGLSAAVAYSNDTNATHTYNYTPTSGGGGAPSGYDANVTSIQWTLSGALGPASAINSGTATYQARVK